MSRKLTIAMVAAAACCVAFATPASAAINLNTGFELGAGADAENWTEIFFGGGATTVAERTDVEPLTGDYHMSLFLAGTEASGSHAEAQNLTPLDSVTPGELYDFSFQAKRVGPLGVSVVGFYKIEWLDSDGSDGGGVKGQTPLVMFAGGLTESYQSFGFTGEAAAAGSDAALIKIYLDGGAMVGASATVYVDDAVLTPEPTSILLMAAGGLIAIRRRRTNR